MEKEELEEKMGTIRSGARCSVHIKDTDEIVDIDGSVAVEVGGAASSACTEGVEDGDEIVNVDGSAPIDVTIEKRSGGDAESFVSAEIDDGRDAGGGCATTHVWR